MSTPTQLPQLDEQAAEVRLWSVPELARLLGVSAKTLRVHIGAGRLTVTHSLGKSSQRVSHAEAVRFVRSFETQVQRDVA